VGISGRGDGHGAMKSELKFRRIYHLGFNDATKRKVAARLSKFRVVGDVWICDIYIAHKIAKDDANVVQVLSAYITVFRKA
jgi:hypothetical protein